MKKYSLLIFDWDGTLYNSIDKIVESLIKACKDLGYYKISTNMAKYVIGLGLRDALKHIVPELPENKHNMLAKQYRFHYLKDDKVNLYPNVKKNLIFLKNRGIKLAIATGKNRQGLNRSLSKFSFEKMFVSTRCAGESVSKPNPEMLSWILNDTKTPAKSAVMIGDTTHDLKMANNAKIDCIGVSYGAHTKEMLEICNPIFCAKNDLELFEWLKKNC